MKYTEVIPAMNKCAGNPVSAFLRLLNRMVYGTDFEDDEKEGRKMMENSLGQAMSDASAAMTDIQKTAPDLKPTPAPAPAQSGTGDAYTKFKEQHNTNN